MTTVDFGIVGLGAQSVLSKICLWGHQRIGGVRFLEDFVVIEGGAESEAKWYRKRQLYWRFRAI